MTDYMAFIQEFKSVFDHADRAQSSTQRLLCLHQGSSLVADYAIHFCILATGSNWNKPALVTLFHEGLSADIQLEVSCKDAGLSLDNSISLAITHNQHLCGKVRHSHSSPRSVERSRSEDHWSNTFSKLGGQSKESRDSPMERTSHILAGDHRCHLVRGLCLYCSEEGHFRDRKVPPFFRNSSNSQQLILFAL